MTWGKELWRAVELLALSEQLQRRFARDVAVWWAIQWKRKAHEPRL